METKNQQNLIARAPVVAILGHIDHGKSTLLDYIRKTNTTAKEAGGITQHISAYEVVLEGGRKITFLDTPGHEAFCAIRERGSRIADIDILVVSAEDGVKPQTIEALKCIKDDGTPFIVAINKIDKPGANIDKTKQNLAENEVLVEGWGGTVPVVAISAKTGQNIEDLLEMILLQADITELKGEEGLPASGFVIESNMNPQKGVSATLLIKDGSLRKGDFVAVKGAWAPVRMIEDYRGVPLINASFSSPIRITGWSGAPAVGEEFQSFGSKIEAEKFAHTIASHKETLEEPTSATILPIIIKADTLGSLEAIAHELKKISNEKIEARVVSSSIGAISEKDVKMAIGSKAFVVGFGVSADKNATILAMRDSVEIKTFSIIYELTQWVKEQLDKNTPKENVETVTGKAKILKVFSKAKDKQVVGGKVEMGEIKTGSLVKIFRRDNPIGEGRVRELQAQKIKTGTVVEPQEFGSLLESKIEIFPGDTLVAVSF